MSRSSPPSKTSSDIQSIVAGAVKYTNCVRKQMRDRIERLSGAFGASGKIDDQGFRAGDRNAARQYRGWRLAQAFAAHLFADPGNYAIGNGLRGFRRVVARANAGSTGGQNKIDSAGVGPFR